MKRTDDFRAGAISVALPTMVGMVVTYLYQVIDALWIARLGAGAPTAVVMAGAILALFLALNDVAGIGSLPLFTQAYGAGDHEGTGALFRKAIVLKFHMGLLLGALYLLFLEKGLFLYTANAEIAEPARRYGGLMALSIVLVMPYYTINTALRVIGHARKTMITALCCSLVNILLDPLLIFGAGPGATLPAEFSRVGGRLLLGAGSPELFGHLSVPSMGVCGAALATVLSQLAGLLVAGGLLARGGKGIRCFPRKVAELLPDPAFCRRTFAIGLPAGAMVILFNLEQNLVVSLMEKYGTDASDGFGIASRVRHLIFVATWGLSVGASISAGRLIGAGRHDEIRRGMGGLALAAGLLLSVIALPAFLFAREILALFTPDSPAVVESGAMILRFFILISFLSCAALLRQAVFEGAGRNVPILKANLLAILLLEMPLLVAVQRGFDLGIPYFMGGMLLGAAAQLLLMNHLFHTDRWEVNRRAVPKRPSSPPNTPPLRPLKEEA